MASDEIHKGLEGVVIDESALGRVFGDEGRLVFRGYDVEDIAEHGDFEETLYLMWHGELPTQSAYDEFSDLLASKRPIDDEIVEVLEICAELDQHPMGALLAAVSLLDGRDPNVDADFETDHDAVVEIGASIAAKAATITAAYSRIQNGKDPIAPRDDLDHAENFLYMLDDEVPPSAFAEAMDTALQIHMEHGANASTFTTRVISSTLANPYRAVAGGIGALSGPLHGGANQDVLDMLEELDRSGHSLGEWFEERLDSDEVIYGWGHRVYNVKDPRAKILQGMAQSLIDEGLGDPKWFELATELEDYIVEETDLLDRGIAPNVDYYSGSMYQQMNIPRDLYTAIFTMSRIGGWMGHILEQYADNRIIRPRVKYVGDLDNEWVPIENR
ncbi:MAG: citrate/2-methylcitrate synthase [Natronomonas sp.]